MGNISKQGEVVECHIYSLKMFHSQWFHTYEETKYALPETEKEGFHLMLTQRNTENTRRPKVSYGSISNRNLSRGCSLLVALHYYRKSV